MRAAAILAVAVLVVGATLALPRPASALGERLVLRVGDLTEMLTRNPLRTSLTSYADESDPTAGILAFVYSHPVLHHPATNAVVPYLAKGVDADGNGVFDADEYGVFSKDAASNASDIVVYFDFNGVRWHDGVQMNVMDLFFSLEIASLLPRYDAPLRPLMDRGGGAGSNFTSSRWLAVSKAPKTWAGEGSMAGDPSLRVAVRFRLQTPYARFYDSTLGDLWLLPRHVWEGTGSGTGTPRHADFGRAIYPEGDPRAGLGIPAAEIAYLPFSTGMALAWEPRDTDVIGAGPFRFATWVSARYERLDRYDAYYVGTDPTNPSVTHDSRLGGYMHLPFIEQINFTVYRTVQLAVLAIQAGDIDYYRGILPPEFVPALLGDPRIRLWANAELGFDYLAYNLRRVPFGYSSYPPANATRDDVGLPFRLAFARLVDKVTYVRDYLLGYADYFPPDGPVSPANTFWYNGSLPAVRYDPAVASTMLDNAGWVDTDGDGWRELPGIGDARFTILVPQADYDPVRLGGGAMFADAARAVGLNVQMEPVPSGILRAAVENGSFDMAVLHATVGDTDPDFLYPFYHCDPGPGSPNVAGYCDPMFDRVVEASRTAMDSSERQRLVRWSQGILMGDRPVEPLAFRERIEAQRTDRFVNWSVYVGTIWNYWSIIGVRPVTIPIYAQFTLGHPSAVAGGARARLVAVVRTTYGDPVPDASVTLQSVPESAGRFVESGSATVSGTTGPAGQFTATYEAALVTEPHEVSILGIAEHPDFPEALQRSFSITVYPNAARFLNLQVSFPAGDITAAGSLALIGVDVLDGEGFPATGADVSATVTPVNATLSPLNGTAAEMASLTLSPPAHLGADQLYRVSLNATMAGYIPAQTNVSILVVPEPAGPPPSPVSPWPIVAGVAAVGAVAVAFASISWALRRRTRSRHTRKGGDLKPREGAGKP